MAYRDYFPIGVAIRTTTISRFSTLIKQQFGSVTAENAMKPEPLHPERNRYFFTDADTIVDFAKNNDLLVRGHTLIWHNQTPAWMFRGASGSTATREELMAVTEDHIKTVVGRYKGRVYCWDVVNEAVSDSSNEYLRNTPYLKIIGEDYIKLAFKWAHEADPDALLFYNDYSTENPAKRDKIIRLVKSLLDEGIPINGIGLQCHYNIYSTPLEELERSIKLFSEMGLLIHVTELDMSIYSNSENNLKFDTLPEDRKVLQIDKYTRVMKILRDNRDKVSSVSFWGLSDNLSWLNDFPVKGRNDWPLLYDKNLHQKECMNAIMNFDND